MLARTAPPTACAWQMAQVTLATWSAVLDNLGVARHVASTLRDQPMSAQSELASVAALYAFVDANAAPEPATTTDAAQRGGCARRALARLAQLPCAMFADARTDVKRVHAAHAARPQARLGCRTGCGAGRSERARARRARRGPRHDHRAVHRAGPRDQPPSRPQPPARPLRPSRRSSTPPPPRTTTATRASSCSPPTSSLDHFICAYVVIIQLVLALRKEGYAWCGIEILRRVCGAD
ncbi:hypothetical protein L1887_55206 [Cichorium endivia]|nr:hypothetical protein L1887_55206 [Cichorium endivia]